jgi:GGDEF domain-containing protein
LQDISSGAEEMLTLYELAQSLSGQLSLADAGDVIAKHLRRIVPASLCVFFVYDIKRDELVASHASGDGASLLTGIRIQLGERLTGWVAANRRTVVNSDPVLDFGETAKSIKPCPKSCLSTPLVAESELVGVLSLYSPDRDAYNEDHKRTIEIIAGQVSQTVRRALDFDQTKAAALKDASTGLPNLEQLKRLTSLEAHATSFGLLPYSLLFLVITATQDSQDVSYVIRFESHITSVVAAIRRGLRGADILFRYSTSEFVVLLPHTDSDTASLVADRISGSVCALTRSDWTGVLVASATAPMDGQGLTQLIDVARSRTCHSTRPVAKTRELQRSIH